MQTYILGKPAIWKPVCTSVCIEQQIIWKPICTNVCIGQPVQTCVVGNQSSGGLSVQAWVLGNQLSESLSVQTCVSGQPNISKLVFARVSIPDMFEQPIIRKPFCACLPASKRGAANCREAFLYKRVYWATKYPHACLYKGTVTPNVTEQPVIRSLAYLPIPSRSVEQPVGWKSICTILPIYLPTVSG